MRSTTSPVRDRCHLHRRQRLMHVLRGDGEQRAIDQKGRKLRAGLADRIHRQQRYRLIGAGGARTWPNDLITTAITMRHRASHDGVLAVMRDDARGAAAVRERQKGASDAPTGRDESVLAMIVPLLGKEACRPGRSPKAPRNIEKNSTPASNTIPMPPITCAALSGWRIAA